MKVDAPLRLVGLPASFVAGDEASILQMEPTQQLLAPTLRRWSVSLCSDGDRRNKIDERGIDPRLTLALGIDG
jgi:hypothetical protein